ncbi:glycosyl hydrolase [Streptomyces sp. NPDC088733]|uniref:glycosyl hydrolase n=1 Tax=Streptomyces sp. NPDC088733 TaxID=3365880 RepID=UPI003818778D
MHDDTNRPEGAGVSRRTLLIATAVAGTAAALAPAAPANAAPAAGGEAPGRGHGTAAAGSFARPGAAVRPKFRWWWPDGLVDPDEIRREVDQIADAGFGGAEIAAVHHSVKDTSVLDTEHHGWGSPAWTAGVRAALDQARRRGITIDLTIGPSWPAAVPGITPDSEAAVQELALGAVTVAAGAAYDGPVPPPAAAPASGVTRQELVALLATRVDPANATRKETGLDRASAQDLTASAGGGTVSWTAPEGGDWVLTAFWRRGTGQTPEGGPHTAPTAYVVDHFSAAGTSAVTGFWERNVLTKEFRGLLRAAGGMLFEDSLEIETKALPWTPGLPAAFERRTGYALLPVLPVVAMSGGNQVYAYDTVATRQIRHDFWDTVSELYTTHHLTALRDWAHPLGLGLRAQPYGLQTDAIASAALLDIPEGESLGFKNLDDFRCLAGGRDMAGHTVLSCEAGAYTGSAYSTTWEKFLRTMGGAYAAGVNQTVVHGFSYATLPGVKWPGYAAFTPYNGTVGYGESWGPRHPTWRHVGDVSGYLSRVHHVTQRGTARADVAVFRQTGYTATGIGASWFTSTGIPLGWTHQFLSGPLLDLPSARVRDGRLAPDGPAYRALFVEADFFSGSAVTLTPRDAEHLLRLTRAGLPVVLLGDWSAVTTPGVADAAELAGLRSVVAELLAQPRVRQITDKTAVGQALADLGVEPDVRYAASSTLLTMHRYEDGTDWFYLCNGKHAETVKPPVAAIDHEITVRATRPGTVPYLLDPWTGEARPLALYGRDGERFTFRVALQPAESMVVAFAPPGRLGARPGRVHATATDAGDARFDGGRLVLRARTAGTYATTLSGGDTVRTVVAEVPAERELTAWTLDAEDWRPGADPDRTVVVRHRVELEALAPWNAIPELADASGIGRYRATVDLDGPWSGGYGALLDLGEVTDTFRVTVNGRPAPVTSLIDPVVDLGPLLRRGRNTVEVEVATTLLNRLRVSDPSVYGGAASQRTGLVGPVRLIPYGEAAVRK